MLVGQKKPETAGQLCPFGAVKGGSVCSAVVVEVHGTSTDKKQCEKALCVGEASLVGSAVRGGEESPVCSAELWGEGSWCAGIQFTTCTFWLVHRQIKNKDANPFLQHGTSSDKNSAKRLCVRCFPPTPAPIGTTNHTLPGTKER